MVDAVGCANLDGGGAPCWTVGCAMLDGVWRARHAAGDPTESAAERAERVERDKLEARRLELDEAEATRQAACEALESAQAQLTELEAARPSAEAALKAASDQTAALQSKHAVRQKALRLLSDEQATADTIERTTQKKAQLEQLKAECAAELEPLDREIADFEAGLQVRREGATAKIRRMKDLQTSMRAMVDQLQSRDEMSARLTSELERIPKGQPRSAYTRRIMDIVKSLRKQKVDIEKILADIRESQLEVNATAETLSRSFAAADEVVYRDAFKDPASKLCYKALAKLHETFGLLGESVQEIGNTGNALRDLQTRTDELGLRNTAEAIERMGADLRSLREENAALRAGDAAAPGAGQGH